MLFWKMNHPEHVQPMLWKTCLCEGEGYVKSIVDQVSNVSVSHEHLARRQGDKSLFPFVDGDKARAEISCIELND